MAAGELIPFPEAVSSVELRHLRAFVAVAEELNFGRAAARLHLTQPSLSRQISTLERLIGCQLLRRTTRHVELTLAGAALLDRARELLRDIEDAISVTQHVGEELPARAAALWAPLIALTTDDSALDERRRAYERLHARLPLPPDVSVAPATAGGVPSLVVAPAGNDDVPRILYLHGGGYVMGSAFGFRHLAAAIAVAADVPVLVPDYRLAPEHPFPAAIDDALAAYGWLVDHMPAGDRPILAGDSAGGGLAMAALLGLRERRRPLPAGVMLLCPWLTVPAEGDSPAGRDAMSAYFGDQRADDPRISALDADLAGMPPLLVQAALGDLCLDDARALVSRAEAAGVDAELQTAPVDMHVFHLFWSFLPEAATAVQALGMFAGELLDPVAARSTG